MEAMGVEGKSVAETVTSETAMKPPGSPKTTVEATTSVESTVAPKSAVTSKSSVTRGLARRSCEQERYSQGEDAGGFPHLMSSKSWTSRTDSAFGSP